MDVREAGRRGAAVTNARRTMAERRAMGAAGAKKRWGEVRKRLCPVCDLPLGPGRMAKRGGQLVHEDCVEGAPEKIDTLLDLGIAADEIQWAKRVLEAAKIHRDTPRLAQWSKTKLELAARGDA